MSVYAVALFVVIKPIKIYRIVMVENQQEFNLGEWTENGAEFLSKDNLRKLLNNQIPFIRIKNFVSEQHCLQMVADSSDQAFGFYDNVVPPIQRIGCTVFEYERGAADGYFEQSKIEAKKRNRFFASTVNPIDKLIHSLAEVSGRSVSIARSDKGDEYYAGLLRKIECGTELHIDYAPAEQQGWMICEVFSQLAWNLYLQVSGNDSGKTIIYNRCWQAKDDKYRGGSYGFDIAVVDGCNHVELHPQVGEVILFNTRNYHHVTPSDSSRFTLASAIGELPSGNLVFWS